MAQHNPAVLPVALLQPRNAPVVNEDAHYAAFMHDLEESRNLPQEPNNTSITDMSESAQLNCKWQIGDLVLVKREVWPSYACDEQDGQGWEAKIINSNSNSSLVQFTRARSSDGNRYANERILHSHLTQLPRTTSRKKQKLRGGCAAGQAPRARLAPPVKGTPNEAGYPQLVASNHCALCKMPLPPITEDKLNWPQRHMSTGMVTPERLQCERCGRVRYCSAHCAHIHYWACHKEVCPLPSFSTQYDAEYIIRQGSRYFSFPVRCVDTSLTEADHLNAPRRYHARVRLWTGVAHSCSGQEETTCKWCTDNATSQEQLHDTWFIGIITCVRASNPAVATDVLMRGGGPPFREQLSIYESHPVRPGWENMPAVHACARYPCVGYTNSVPADQAATHGSEHAALGGAAEPPPH